jgi:hypothetical protein
VVENLDEVGTKELFVDTSGWGHLADAAQSYHSLAEDLYRAARRQDQTIVTTAFTVG